VQEIVSTINRKGQVTLPIAVRERLGLSTAGKVAFVIDGADVRLRPVTWSVSSLYGSVAPLRGRDTSDFEEQIDEALAEEASRIAKNLEYR
jgi:AbrB family looped-hinge helix DNA binding protein